MPVWAIPRNGEYFSGHIDGLTFYNDMIIIGDYKPTEKEIYPQKKFFPADFLFD